MPGLTPKGRLMIRLAVVNNGFYETVFDVEDGCEAARLPIDGAQSAETFANTLRSLGEDVTVVSYGCY